MTPVTIQDLLSSVDYEHCRQEYRQRIIERKKRRRITVADCITLVFENRETVQFQTQEMIRAEHIVDTQKIQEELDVYNALLPTKNGLSATLFIEITDQDRIETLLNAFRHIDGPDTLAIRIGNEVVYATFESGHSKEDKISAVHFVQFPLTPACTAMLPDLHTSAYIQIRHPYCQADVSIPTALRQEWLTDLDIPLP
ncbi:MAG: DUF3501 family protein [Nitrospirales bacterium]|nr:DUF3501 family protein [Nitrospirales bacterium]